MDSVLLEAKREYTEQVVSKVIRPLYDEIYNIWKKSLDESSSSPMRHFQDSLENLAKMDEKDMLAVTDRCIQKTGCSYFGDLITAIFVAHTRVLLSVRKEETKEGYRLQVPTPNRFLRACILCCAREFWKSPYLYYQNEQNNKITKIQVQKNLREAESIIKQAVRDTIRSLLPLKDVLDVAITRGDTGDIVIEESVKDMGDTVTDISESSSEDTKEDTEEDISESSLEDTKEDTTEDATEVIVEDTKEDTTEDATEVITEDTSEDTRIDPLGDAINQVQESLATNNLPAYDETDLADDSGDSTEEGFSGWETIEIKSPPDEQILMESLSDAISLDPEPSSEEEVTIDAEEL